MSHCFERRQSEAFVERREHKNLGDIVKDAQHFDRNESQETHVVLHAASDHCAPQARMSGRSSPMMISFKSGSCFSFSSSLFNAEKASIVRTTFLCGRMAPAYRRNG